VSYIGYNNRASNIKVFYISMLTFIPVRNLDLVNKSDDSLSMQPNIMIRMDTGTIVLNTMQPNLV